MDYMEDSKRVPKLPLKPNRRVIPDKIRLSELRTQKAKGIVVLYRCKNVFGTAQPFSAIVQSQRLIQSAIAHLSQEGVPLSEELIARPCPVRPRHGFVDSRPVKTYEEVLSTWKETKQHDPQGELVLQPLIQADASAVLTPTALGIGPGREGATSGTKAWTISLPAPKPASYSYLDNFGGHVQSRDALPTHLLECAGIPEHEAPYMEFVRDFNNMQWLVQLRAGPRTSGKSDIIPYDNYKVTKVRSITSHSTSLIEWENETATLPKGTAVYHAGGTVVSHFAMHCLANNIAYITSHIPHVGEVLHTTEALTTDGIAECSDAMRQGVLRGFNTSDWYGPINEVTEFWKEWTASRRLHSTLAFALFGIHNYGADHGTIGSYITGAACANLWRLLAIVCCGEYRHSSYYEGINIHRGREMSEITGRDKVFAYLWYLPPELLNEILTKAAYSFLNNVWHRSYGGLQWGHCAYSALRLGNALARFYTKPTPHNKRRLLQVAHYTVNIVHNNGWVFNKFADGNLADKAANASRLFLVNHVLSPLQELQRLSTKPLEVLKFTDARDIVGWRSDITYQLRKRARGKWTLKPWLEYTAEVGNLAMALGYGLAYRPKGTIAKASEEANKVSFIHYTANKSELELPTELTFLQCCIRAPGLIHFQAKFKPGCLDTKQPSSCYYKFSVDYNNVFTSCDLTHANFRQLVEAKCKDELYSAHSYAGTLTRYWVFRYDDSISVKVDMSTLPKCIEIYLALSDPLVPAAPWELIGYRIPKEELIYVKQA